MNKAEILELAAKVEKLEGPDREVDALIAPIQGLRVVDEGHPIGRMCYDDIGSAQLMPRYTASLDAALTLVGDPCFRVERHPMYGVYAYVGDHDAYAATPALALVLAALRARAEDMDNG